MSLQNSQATANPAILAQRYADDANRYFQRHGYGRLTDLAAPDPDLTLVVVIPALAEPDAVATLESVAAALRPQNPVEILLIVNAAADASEEIRAANARCLETATAWSASLNDPRLRCHVLDYRDLPVVHAGVGLARKLGMDTALARLAATDTGRGVIVSLDADCRVDATYLTALEEYFRQETDAVGATIHFEHPLDDAENNLLPAIIDYELHLRCYKQGLQVVGSSYARHTVGSALAVRSEIYAQEGGMNRRAAGEDFYFINKLLKRGRVGEIYSTTVMPSVRISGRVPFGTGAAMSRAATQPQTTYAPIVYQKLRLLIDELGTLDQSNNLVQSTFSAFLATAGFDTWLSKTRENVASTDALGTQLRRWLDGFRTMKFINWLTESRYPRVLVTEAARELLAWQNVSPSEDPLSLLQQLRQLDCRSQ